MITKIKIFQCIAFTLLLLISLVQAQSERFMAILPLSTSIGGEYTWVARGIEEILYDKFSNLNSVDVFEKETLHRILSDYNVRQPAELTVRKAFGIGKETGVDVILAADYSVIGGKLKLNFRVVSTYTGADIYNETFQGKLSDIFALHEKGILKILQVMEISLNSSERQDLANSSTNSIQAFENYCRAYIEFQKGAGMEIVATYFTRALKQDPDFWEAQYNLGVIYYNFDKYDRALGQFEKVVQRNPTFFKPYYGTGVIYYLKRNYRKAIRNLKKVLTLEHDHDRTLYYLGRVYVQMDSIVKGLEYLNKSAEINPNYAPTQYQIGMANMQRGWYKSAIRAFRNSLKLNPDNYIAHNSLGECYYRLQRFDEAIFQYNKSTELKKNFSTAYFNKGNTFYKRGALEEIVDAYLELLETRYSRNESGGEISEIVQEIKEFHSASSEASAQVYRSMVKAYRNALFYEPEFFEAAFNLALTYENMVKPDSAEYYYNTAIRHNPKLVRAYMRLGRLKEKQGRYDEALKNFKEVVRIEPSYFAATPRLGEEYRYINIIETVLHEYQLKIDLNPKSTDNLLVIARIFRSLGRYGQAQDYYRRIVQIDPRNLEANRALRELERQLN